MTKISGIVVCVNYEDLLKMTLEKNMRVFHKCLVITSPTDQATIDFASTIPGVELLITDAFYRYGAKFNKGLAMEEGFKKIRDEWEPEWILVWDADILFPDTLDLSQIKPGNLYNCPRRIVDDPAQWKPNTSWGIYPISNDKAWPGYFQLFHVDDETIKDKLPWYDVTFAHAGGGDGYFESRWSSPRKIKLNQYVLHFGPRDANWFGRATKKVGEVSLTSEQLQNRDLMHQFLAFKGWGRSGNVESFNEKVEVPGAQPTGYKLLGRKDRNP